jgi:hypothetical protein
MLTSQVRKIAPMRQETEKMTFIDLVPKIQIFYTESRVLKWVQVPIPQAVPFPQVVRCFRSARHPRPVPSAVRHLGRVLSEIRHHFLGLTTSVAVRRVPQVRVHRQVPRRPVLPAAATKFMLPLMLRLKKLAVLNTKSLKLVKNMVSQYQRKEKVGVVIQKCLSVFQVPRFTMATIINW